MNEQTTKIGILCATLALGASCARSAQVEENPGSSGKRYSSDDDSYAIRPAPAPDGHIARFALSSEAEVGAGESAPQASTKAVQLPAGSVRADGGGSWRPEPIGSGENRYDYVYYRPNGERTNYHGRGNVDPSNGEQVWTMIKRDNDAFASQRLTMQGNGEGVWNGRWISAVSAEKEAANNVNIDADRLGVVNESVTYTVGQGYQSRWRTADATRKVYQDNRLDGRSFDYFVTNSASPNGGSQYSAFSEGNSTPVLTWPLADQSAKDNFRNQYGDNNAYVDQALSSSDPYQGFIKAMIDVTFLDGQSTY